MSVDKDVVDKVKELQEKKKHLRTEISFTHNKGPPPHPTLTLTLTLTLPLTPQHRPPEALRRP